jgi:hypothetical protein
VRLNYLDSIHPATEFLAVILGRFAEGGTMRNPLDEGLVEIVDWQGEVT